MSARRYAIYGRRADLLAIVEAPSAVEALGLYNRTRRHGSPWGETALPILPVKKP